MNKLQIIEADDMEMMKFVAATEKYGYHEQAPFVTWKHTRTLPTNENWHFLPLHHRYLWCQLATDKLVVTQ